MRDCLYFGVRRERNSETMDIEIYCSIDVRA
jgi:hypothetical protein